MFGRTGTRGSKSYGRNLGVAFQLVDDAIDYDSDAARDGQGQQGDRISAEGKMTLPVILAHARGNEEETQVLEGGDCRASAPRMKTLPTAIALIAKHNALEDTPANARAILRTGRSMAISIFPDGKAPGGDGRSRAIRRSRAGN